jgi:membrane protein required for colicin V production
LYIDIAFLVLLAYAFYRGYSKGLVMAILSFIGYITAMVVTFYFTQQITLFFHWEHRWGPVLSYIIVFAAIVILFILAAKLIEKLLEQMEINFINKILGGILSTLLVTIIFSGILWLGQMVHLISEQTFHSSKTAGILLPIAPFIYKLAALLFPVLKTSLIQFQNYLSAYK